MATRVIKILRRAISLGSSPPSIAEATSLVELEPPPLPTATGRAARRRRKRNRRKRDRTATDAASVTLELYLDASTSTTSGAEHNDSSGSPDLQDRELREAKTDASDHAAPSADLYAKNDPTAEATSSADSKNTHSAATGPKNADPDASNPKNPKNGDPDASDPLHAPPVADHDGLHGAPLNIASTATKTVMTRRSRAAPAGPKPQPHMALAPAALTRSSPALAPPRPLCPPPAAALAQHSPPAASPLDDVAGVQSFFLDKLFDEPVQEESRVKHLGYVAACSSLKKRQTFCLACYLSDDKKKHAPIANEMQEVIKHMRAHHKGGWFRCAKHGCFAMASNLKDINLHQCYAHHM